MPLQNYIARLRTFGQSLFSKEFDPATIPQPMVNEHNESNIKGIYIIGDVAGTPLIKAGLNQGTLLIEQLAPEMSQNNTATDYDIIIVGAGSAGMGAAMKAHEMGLKYLVLEQGAVANTIRNFTKGKWLFAEPDNMPLISSVWFEECAKEEIIEKWDALVAEVQLNIRTYERVENITGKNNTFTVVSRKESYTCQKIVLALGKAGNPRKLGIPGEDTPKVRHLLADPDEFKDRDILIVGAGDVAAEAILALCDNNRVTMAAIDKELTFPKKRNIDALRQKESEGRLAIHLNTKVSRIDDNSVDLQQEAEAFSLPNDQVFTMIGADPPLRFFRKIGIRMETEWYPARYLRVALIFLFCYSLYAVKAPYFPFNVPIFDLPQQTLQAGPVPEGLWLHHGTKILDDAPFKWQQFPAGTVLENSYWVEPGEILPSPVRYIGKMNIKEYVTFHGLGMDITPSKVYTMLYTLIMLVFGSMALYRWGIKYRDRYQIWRYITLISVQVIFPFLITLFITGNWRWDGLIYAWPLFFNTFFDNPGTYFLVWGALQITVAIPIAVFWHGKRYCTWVCGCGGLAETLGDRWRHLSPKGKVAHRWEFMNKVVLVAAVGVTAMVLLDLPGAVALRASYSYIADFWLVGVIPVTLYFVYGGKIWCRFWCPLAKVMEYLSRAYSKLNIVSNDKCITCGLCSRFCQVGIDVMAFAKNQAPFSNLNTACIHCGICITVCPMDVLQFDTSGADQRACGTGQCAKTAIAQTA